MVFLHVKKENESLFLFETKLENLVENIVESLTEIYNGCLKVERLCSGIAQLQEFGVIEQSEHELVENLKNVKLNEIEVNIKENHTQNLNSDRKLNEDLKTILNKTMSEAKGIISKEQVKSNVCLTMQHIHDAVTILKGGIDIVYPQYLPLHHPVRCEFENRENLSENEEKMIFHPVMTQLWFAGKALENGKKLADYLGRNEKTKVIVKLQRRGNVAPPREPILTEEEKKALMMSEFRRREELRKMEEDEDNSYLDSEWADNLHMKKSFHGVNNISWKP